MHTHHKCLKIPFPEFKISIREKSDVDAGIAYNIIIGTSEKFKPLMGTKCTTSVRYLNDAIFGINKCKLSEKSNKLLNNIN